MARFESDSFTKKSSKFENFLKKNLDENGYDRIRAYESCIVCSHKEQRAFKYVVLSDECLYLTENPPKTINVAVKLEDLFGIELIDDLPEFLSGQEQKNTTHIEIKYWDEVVEKVKSNSRPSSQNSQRPDESLNKSKSIEEDKFLAGDYKLSSDDDRDSLSGSISKSMPEGSLKSMLKSSRSAESAMLKSSLKKVTIQDQSRSPSSRKLPSPPESDDPDEERGRRNSGSPQTLRSSKVDGRSSTDNLTVPPVQQVSENVARIRRTLHLYMLVPDSKMLVLIRSAVNNHLIRSTLSIDTDYAQRAVLSPYKTKHTSDLGGKIFSEKLDTLFSTLTKDLMDPGNTMERTFELLLELKAGTEKYFLLKKLFWKSGELFSKLVSILKTYLPRSPLPNVNSDSGRARRADEFELIILIIQTLGLMFRETEILPSRLRVLKSGSGKLVSELIEVLTCFPELPVKYIPPTTKASKLLMQTEADKWKCLADAELHELFVEFTSGSTSVLFELLVIAQQSHWGRSETSFFNVCWLMNILEGLNTTERFLERAIGQAMRYVQPSKRVELSPQEAIIVFQEFYIQHAIMAYSPQLASFIRNNYTEEFKYYIQGPILNDKLPKCYPISARTILLIEEVMSQVLQRKASLLPDRRYIH